MHFLYRKIILISFLLSLKIVSAQDYQPVKVFNDHAGGITVMTKDPGRKYLISGDTKGHLYFQNLSTGETIQNINAHFAEVSQLQFNSTGKLLISATPDGEIKIFDFSKNKIIQSIYSPDYSGIRFVLFSIADGFVYFNGNRKLFKTRSDLTQKVEQVLIENDTITDAVITTDRSAMIYSTGTYLKVLNTRTDLLQQEFNTGPSKIEKIALVKDSLIATWSVDGTINFWKYNLGQVNPLPLFFLKAGNPTTMNFTEDGKMMCSGNIGNWARIWKPMQRTILQELFSHTKAVSSSCFGTSDDELYTGSLDGNIILWKKGAPPPIAPVIPLITVQEQNKSETVVVVPKPVISDVVMSAENVPKIISGRNVISNQKFEINSPQLTIYVYDNSYLDGDTMSLFFNGTWILDHYGVTKQKHPLELKLTPNTNNYLVLFANNLGKTPPNTAAIEFDDGKSKHFFKLSSDLKSCSAINFFYKQ
jgi:WD40 repeat protein